MLLLLLLLLLMLFTLCLLKIRQCCVCIRVGCKRKCSLYLTCICWRILSLLLLLIRCHYTSIHSTITTIIILSCPFIYVTGSIHCTTKVRVRVNRRSCLKWCDVWIKRTWCIGWWHLILIREDHGDCIRLSLCLRGSCWRSWRKWLWCGQRRQRDHRHWGVVGLYIDSLRWGGVEWYGGQLNRIRRKAKGNILHIAIILITLHIKLSCYSISIDGVKWSRRRYEKR